MRILAWMHMVQTDAAMLEQVARIADMQRWMAISMIVIGVVLILSMLGALGVLLWTWRRLKAVEGALRPSLNRVHAAVDTAGDMVDQVHERVEAIARTLDGANDSLRSAGRAVEVRARELVAVMDVVREQAQELLLDGAATAHGIHATARALRSPRTTTSSVRPAPPPPIPEEAGRSSHGQG